MILRALGAAFCGQWAQGISVAVVLVEELVEVRDADAEYALERLLPVFAVDAFGVELCEFAESDLGC